MNQIDFSTLYYANPEFVLRKIAGEYVVVPIGSAAQDLNGLVNLNSTGAFIWQSLLEKPGSVETVSNELAEEYSADPEKVEKDVAEFMIQAIEQKFLILSTI